MSKRKSTSVTCFLDIKDLLKFDSTLHYFSTCPACKGLVSEHKDADFQRQQLAQITAEQKDDDEPASNPDSSTAAESPRPKKKQKVVISTAQAASLVQKGKLCCTIGCTRRPVYNFKDLKPRFCREHKEDAMVNITEKKCDHEGCEKRITYKEVGKQGKKKCKKTCTEHKTDGMIKVSESSKVCTAEGCVRAPCFNFRGEKALFCTFHKEKDMVNLYKNECRHAGCDNTASFNVPGKKMGRYCSAHKQADMINLKVTPCAQPGCAKKPYYNFRTEKVGKFCTTHAEPGMVNLLVIQSKRVCDRNGCEKCACYAFAKTDKSRYCAAHRERGMVDVQNIICEREECGKRPNFNFVGLKKGRFCSKHKEEGMVNVASRPKKKPVAEAEKEAENDTEKVTDKRVV